MFRAVLGLLALGFGFGLVETWRGASEVQVFCVCGQLLQDVILT